MSTNWAPPAPAQKKHRGRWVVAGIVGTVAFVSLLGSIGDGEDRAQAGPSTTAAPSTTEAPATTAPSTTAPSTTAAPSTTEAPPTSETAQNMLWWTNGGEDAATEVASDLEAIGNMDPSDFAGAMVLCDNLAESATVLGLDLPLTEMGVHMKASADAYVTGASLCSVMDFEGALPHFERAVAEMELATAAL